jgi:hypothetical protein
VWFDGVHGDAWGPSRPFEHILAYLLYDMSSDDVAINEDLLSNMTNPLQRRGSLGKLLHWQQRYNNPLKSDDNQLRHESCQSIKPRDPNNNDDMSGICTREDKMVRLLKQYNCLSELTDLYCYSTIEFAPNKIVMCKCDYREWPSPHPSWRSCRVSN